MQIIRLKLKISVNMFSKIFITIVIWAKLNGGCNILHSTSS